MQLLQPWLNTRQPSASRLQQTLGMWWARLLNVISGLIGVTPAAPPSPSATGGTITSDSTYYYHTFTSNGTFTPSKNLTCDYIVIAGGGSGGGGRAAGGGAGGLLPATSVSFTNAVGYTVTIGAGGAALARIGMTESSS